MSPVYTKEQIEEMFYDPSMGRKYKHPWLELDCEMSFILRCDDYSKDYKGPPVPIELERQGYKVTRHIQEPKPHLNDDSYHVVITRIE
jgi:hypothetical protein